MKNKIHLIYFLALPAVILSGCVNSSNTSFSSSSSGDIVKEFRAIPYEAYSKEEVYLKMTLENSNQFLVKNIYVYVYNLGNDWGIKDVWGEKTYNVSDSLWYFDIDASFRYREKITIGDSNVLLYGDVYINNIENLFRGELPELSIDNVDLFIKRKDISIFIEDIQKFTDIAFRNNYERIADVDISKVFKKASKMPPVYIEYLLPPNRNFGRGEEVEIYWVVKPPSDIPKGKILENDVKARVCYETTNKISEAIRIVSRDEFLSQSLNINKKQISQDQGSVKLTLELRDPLVVSDEDTTINFVITLENLGKGTITSESCKDVLGFSNTRNYEEVNKFNIRIEGMQCNIEDENIYLAYNQKATIPVTCYIDTQKGIPKYDRYIDILVSYTYYEDLSTKIRVKGV